MRAWSTAELTTTPGTVFQYNNANYVILGALVETRSGQSFESYVREQILEPLLMHDAMLGPLEDGAPQLATGTAIGSEHPERQISNSAAY